MPTQLPVPLEDEFTPNAELDYSPNPPEIWRLDWPALGFAYSAVYIIAPRSGWPVKVGISAVALKRLSALQTSHWNKLDIYHYWLCENAKAARKIERAAHQLLTEDSRLMNGEWFDIRAHQAPRIIEFLAEKHGVEITTSIPETAKFERAHERLKELRALGSRRIELKVQNQAEREMRRRSPKEGLAPYVYLEQYLRDRTG